MGFLRYILFLSAAQWFTIVAYILIGITAVASIVFAIKEKNALILTAPIGAWALILFFYFMYDKLHLIIIPIP